MDCFKCNKEMLDEEEKFMCPLEVPYGNVYFHRSCYKELDNLVEFFMEHSAKLIKYLNQREPKRKGKDKIDKDDSLRQER